MKQQKILINNIPAIVWGDDSDKLYVHVHGKLSCKEYAKKFAEIAQAKGYQTLSFDLPQHGERINEDYACDIFNGMHDLNIISDYAFSNYNDVSLFACSIGAYFSLNTYSNKPFKKCLLQSPILDLHYLINQMFIWFNITKEQLYIKQKITTPLETITWDYYEYITNNPIIKWDIPTNILYGAKDELQSIDVMNNFSNKFNCPLTVSNNSEHAFMSSDDVAILLKWLKDFI